MLNTYDLYDLHAILINIRQRPEYEFNEEVILKTTEVLKNWQNNHEPNQIRIALQTISSLDSELYEFVFVKNIYTYYPTFLKDNIIYVLFTDVFEYLLKVIKEKNKEKIIDLADCLHNLPILIVENKYIIPNEYWDHEVKFYRCKWDKSFLVKLQNRFK